jgi:hypothetical protein
LEASQQFFFYRVGLLAPRPTPIPEDHASVFISPRGRVATHFSRLLLHAWVMVGLFLFPSHHTENYLYTYLWYIRLCVYGVNYTFNSLANIECLTESINLWILNSFKLLYFLTNEIDLLKLYAYKIFDCFTTARNSSKRNCEETTDASVMTSVVDTGMLQRNNYLK